MRPGNPRGRPNTWISLDWAVLRIARMQALREGQSPPLVRMPIFETVFGFLAEGGMGAGWALNASACGTLRKRRVKIDVVSMLLVVKCLYYRSLISNEQSYEELMYQKM